MIQTISAHPPANRRTRLRTLLISAVLLAFGLAPAVKATPIISEFMASNDTTIADQDGDYGDWLELYNPDPVPDNLGGWYLTDKTGNLTKWQIPPVTLAPGGYLVIFCSSKNYTNPSQPLATSFNLPASGGYVALVEPNGATVASSYTFPLQYPDISYGITQPSNPSEAPQFGYFTTATPGAANGNRSNLLLSERVTPSVPAGLFTGATTVALNGATGSEHVRYVLAPASTAGDAVAAPTANSPLYTGPITIASTVLLRAAVFSADDSQRGIPTTAMYEQMDNSSANRVDTFSSNLPLVVFDDNGYGLLPYNDTYYSAWIGAFSPGAGGTATLTQAPDFFTPGAMKLHGFSSATFPKQSYDFDLADDLGSDVDEPMFGLDSQDSWDAISLWYFDPTFIHNAFVYSLSRSMGHWAASSKFAEMFIHSAGGPLDASSYAGITTITDRLKVSPDRINIYSISPSDVTAPNVTGGYILRIDHPEDDLYTWTTNLGVTVMLDNPKLDVLVPAQTAYITGYVQQMESAMAADQASGYVTHTYLNYLDRSSWVDFHLLNLFVENVDAFQFSEYFTKDVNGLIKAGPVWDFDRSMGSADGRDANPAQWSPYSVPDFWSIGWWGYVCHDPDFMQAWVDRWQNLRLSVLSNSNLPALVNSIAGQLGPAAPARDAARWPDDQSRFPGGWSGEIANMQSWLTTRAQWIDAQFVATPMVSAFGSQVVLVPPAGSQVAYTLDGSDPRLSGGALSPSAQLGSGPVILPASQTLMARSYNASLVGIFPGSPWSSPVNTPSSSVNTTGELDNVSGRMQVGTGTGILTQGFVVTGPAGAAEQVLVRGVGPGLSQYGVPGVLARPVLSVYDSNGSLIATNAGWSTNPNAAAIQAAAALVGAFPLPDGSADAAVLLTLSPGAYTMQVAGLNQTTGIALGETYQITQLTSQVVNVSNRGVVGVNAKMLVTGFSVPGPAQVLVRADGPALAQYGVANPLPQPVLQVYDSNGNLIASNAGWSNNANAAQIAAASAAVGAFPLPPGSADSAVLLTLPPGVYTIQTSGMGGTSGSALAEAFLLPSN